MEPQRPDGLPREYEVLPRVAGAVTNCAPKEVAAEVAEFLRPFASFESLDIVAFEENMSEVVWHSVAGTELPPGDVPIEQTKMWWVHQHQQPLCIADWSRDDRFAVRREALKRLGRAYQSLCCTSHCVLPVSGLECCALRASGPTISPRTKSAFYIP
jgi:hypothetical protein